MGCLKGGQIDENITIQISTMSYKLRKEASKKGHSGVLTGGRVPPHLVRWLLFFFPGVLEAPMKSASQSPRS